MTATILAAGVLLGAETQAPPASPPRAVSSEQSDSGRSKTTDHVFVTSAATDGTAEVELARLAINQASNDRVKAFGQHMVVDHGKAGDELKALAVSKQITLPTSVYAKHQAIHDRLATLSGAAFDRAYITEMVAGHKKAVSDFTRESKRGQDSDVKAWATKTLPTLRDHLRMIEDLEKDVARSRATK
jgi:putative membrane protein